MNIVTCWVVTINAFRIGFIDTSYTPRRTTINYSTIADLPTVHFTVTHTLVFSVFTSRILATDL
jgi:hypothetical protein